MKASLVWMMLIILAAALAGCSQRSPQPPASSIYAESASIDAGSAESGITGPFGSPTPGITPTSSGLPAAGNLWLSADDEQALVSLGLGGSKPLNAPPHFPFNSYGLYWSEQFSLAEGELLILRVSSSLPVSWFGVDWSKLAVRGVLALTDTDEDGWNFIPLYPDNSSINTAANGTELTLSYTISEDGEYQILVKNSSALKLAQLSLDLSVQNQHANTAGDGE